MDPTIRAVLPRELPAGAAAAHAFAVRELDSSLVGTVLGGRYLVEQSISAGGMGVVYQAMQLGLGRRVAVKVMRPDLQQHALALARFEREARLVGGLGHPNIVQVLDFQTATEAQSAWLAMELVAGQSLSELLRTEGSLPPERVISILLGILSALESAHELGAVHRDLKPSNVMVTHVPGVGEVAKVLDFGLAKLTDTDAAATVTGSGVVLGTPMYMAPEQALGERIDGRADIYAAGLIGWTLLAGRHPFPSESARATIAAVIGTLPPSLSIVRPDVPAGLERVITTAIAKQPEARFPSARAFADALRALGGRTTPVPIGTESGALTTAGRDAPTLTSTAGAVVLVTPPPRAKNLAQRLGVPAAVTLLVVVTVAGLALLVGAVTAYRLTHERAAPALAPPGLRAEPEKPPATLAPAPAPTPLITPVDTDGRPLDGTARRFLADADRRAHEHDSHARLLAAALPCVTADGRPLPDPNCIWNFSYEVSGETTIVVNYQVGRRLPYVQVTGLPSDGHAIQDLSHAPDSDALVRRLATECPNARATGVASIIYSWAPRAGDAILVSNGPAEIMLARTGDRWDVSETSCF